MRNQQRILRGEASHVPNNGLAGRYGVTEAKRCFIRRFVCLPRTWDEWKMCPNILLHQHYPEGGTDESLRIYKSINDYWLRATDSSVLNLWTLKKNHGHHCLVCSTWSLFHHFDFIEVQSPLCLSLCAWYPKTIKGYSDCKIFYLKRWRTGCLSCSKRSKLLLFIGRKYY